MKVENGCLYCKVNVIEIEKSMVSMLLTLQVHSIFMLQILGPTVWNK